MHISPSRFFFRNHKKPAAIPLRSLTFPGQSPKRKEPPFQDFSWKSGSCLSNLYFSFLLFLILANEFNCRL